MADRHRIPRPDSEFNMYLQNTTKVLEEGTPTGAVRLDLTPAQATEWIDYRNRWMDIYAKYINIATRTRPVKEAKNRLKKDFTEFSVNPLMRIASSPNLTTADRLTFNLKERKKNRTRRGVITDIPFGQLNSSGGGMVDVRVRRQHDADRCSMHDLADGLEFRYLLMNASDFNVNKLPTLTDCTETLTSKKTIWRMNMGAQNQGKRMCGFVRWVNQTNPANNSGWSELIHTVI